MNNNVKSYLVRQINHDGEGPISIQSGSEVMLRFGHEHEAAVEYVRDLNECRRIHFDDFGTEVLSFPVVVYREGDIKGELKPVKAYRAHATLVVKVELEEIPVPDVEAK